mgnify:CR=1 FL=1
MHLLSQCHGILLNHFTLVEYFFASGILIDIISKPELQIVIDTEHISAFGMTRDERREKLKFQSKGVVVDWDIYDIPTIHRK